VIANILHFSYSIQWGVIEYHWDSMSDTPSGNVAQWFAKMRTTALTALTISDEKSTHYTQRRQSKPPPQPFVLCARKITPSCCAYIYIFKAHGLCQYCKPLWQIKLTGHLHYNKVIAMAGISQLIPHLQCLT